MVQQQDLELVKFSELDSLLTLESSLKLITERLSSEQLKTFTLDQLRQWILSSPNLINATGNTPSLGDNTTRLATTQYVKSELGNVGLNPATNSAYGTIRTNTTDSVPVVYLKSEVDTLLNSTTPITKGGTGATTDTQARSNLSAAKSGNNSDITDLSVLASIPSIIQTALNALVPVGSYLVLAHNGNPTGYLYCDGSAVSRSTYAALFTVIGTTYGIGNGSTTFNLPDCRGRSLFGSGGLVGAVFPSVNGLVGVTGGNSSTTLSNNEMPTHNHGGVSGLSGTLDHTHNATTDFQGVHSHNVNDLGVGSFTTQSAGSANRIIPGTGYNASTTSVGSHQHNLTTGGTNVSLSHSHTISNQGSGQPFSIVPPFILAKVFIKF